MKEFVRFTVFGKPQTAGSKRSLVPTDKNGQPFRSKTTGRIVVSTVDANKHSGPWKREVKAAAIAAVGGDSELLRGPLSLTLLFFVPRPKGHFGTGKNAGNVKASAPAYPATRPDLLKWARAVEDGLQGVLYADDAQIVFEHLSKHFGEPARVEVFLETLESTSELDVTYLTGNAGRSRQESRSRRPVVGQTEARA